MSWNSNGLRIHWITNAVADVDRFQTDEGNNVASFGLFHILSTQSIVRLNLLHFGLHVRAVALNHDRLLTGLNHAIVNSAHANSADIIVVLNAGDLHLQTFVPITMRRGNVLQQRFEHRHNVRCPFAQATHEAVPSSSAGVQHGEIERFNRPLPSSMNRSNTMSSTS